MSALRSFIRSYTAIPGTAQDEQGQTLVEYALIIAFVAIAMVFTLHPLLSGGIAGAFMAIIDVLGEAVGGLSS